MAFLCPSRQCQTFRQPQPDRCDAVRARDTAIPAGIVIGTHQGRGTDVADVCGQLVCSACGQCQAGHQ
jgi:hypothetical protein